MDDCERPRRLRSIHGVDYFPPEFRERAYSRLRQSLELRAKALGILTEKAESKPESPALPDEKPKPQSIPETPSVEPKRKTFDPAIEKATHLKAILKIAEEILETANSSLIENEKALNPLFQDILQVETVHNRMTELYHNQRNRGDFGRWESFLKTALSKETELEIKSVIGNLLSDIDKLHDAFYSQIPYPNDKPSKNVTLQKLSLGTALGGYILDPEEIIQTAHRYLDYLRELIQDIGLRVGLLRGKWNGNSLYLRPTQSAAGVWLASYLTGKHLPAYQRN